MVASICDAIRDRAIVEFEYDGGMRTVEPHAHGISTAGHEVVRGYQVEGFSRSGNPEGWRLYDIFKIEGLRRTGTVFTQDRPNYSPDDRQMRSVHCHV